MVMNSWLLMTGIQSVGVINCYKLSCFSHQWCALISIFGFTFKVNLTDFLLVVLILPCEHSGIRTLQSTPPPPPTRRHFYLDAPNFTYVPIAPLFIMFRPSWPVYDLTQQNLLPRSYSAICINSCFRCVYCYCGGSFCV
jgi:hypothetical protein